MKMNLPTKLTVLRIILTFFMIIFLIFPFHTIGINFPSYNVDGVSQAIDLKVILAGVFFVVASLTDFLDGYLARKNNQVTDRGKMLDAIADKILVNSALIILAWKGFIPVLIPVLIVMRDTIVDVIKMEAGNKGKVVAAIKSGKIKTACMMIGLTLVFIYNLPFEIWNLHLGLFLVYFATLMSVISGIQYWRLNKDIIITDE